MNIIDRIIWTPVERDIIARIVWTPLSVLLLILSALCSPLSAIEVGDVILRQRIATSGRENPNVAWRSGFTITDGVLTLNAPSVSIGGVTGLQAALDGKVSLTGSYTNPSWLVSIPFSKLTGTPTTLAGYGITSFETDAFILTNVTNSLAENQRGLGRVGGRDTGQLGGGTLQWYQSGSDKIMAWSGILQAAALNVTNVSIFVTAPVSPTSAGEVGQMAFDESYLYVCVALNTWKRTALSSW